jgi:hypothetical protein
MPYLMHITRAVLVALCGALVTVIVARFDKYNQEKNNNEDYHTHRPPWDDGEFDRW